MSEDRLAIDSALVRRLIASQFPHWANLTVRPVDPGGWDNSTFRLGDDMKVRLPTAARYAAQVEKERIWLPRLARSLPVPIPLPLATGKPSPDFPRPWSIQGWLEGEPVSLAQLTDERRFAIDLADFLLALQRAPTDDAPPPGPHNFFRGGPLAVYEEETRTYLTLAHGHIDTERAAAVWNEAASTPWHGPAVWVHGDVAAGNLLIRNGRLFAVIDFGSCAVGDPACDLVIAWTVFSTEGREAFRATLSADPGTWARARGWALWKALFDLTQKRPNQPESGPALRIIETLLAEHKRTAG